MLTFSLDFGLENIRFVSFNTLDVVLASGGIIKGQMWFKQRKGNMFDG